MRIDPMWIGSMPAVYLLSRIPVLAHMLAKIGQIGSGGEGF